MQHFEGNSNPGKPGLTYILINIHLLKLACAHITLVKQGKLQDVIHDE